MVKRRVIIIFTTASFLLCISYVGAILWIEYFYKGVSIPRFSLLFIQDSQNTEQLLSFNTTFNYANINTSLRCINDCSKCVGEVCDTVKQLQKISVHFNATQPSHLREQITIVTAYFDLGAFYKGHDQIYRPKQYRKWMQSVSKIKNPVVAFLDTEADAKLFKTLRSHLPVNLTIVHKINREETWSFSLKNLIEYIYHTKGYPKHFPNTVIAEYSCAMHAKYELLRQVILENPFSTRYIAWMDIGYFRSDVFKSTKEFMLSLPWNFDKKLISYTAVYNRVPDWLEEAIFKENAVWLGGGFILGHVVLMKEWTLMYMQLVEHFIKQGLMDTDQQVIYAAANVNKDIRKFIQIYRATVNDGNPWFYLGRMCRRAGSRSNAF